MAVAADASSLEADLRLFKEWEFRRPDFIPIPSPFPRFPWASP